MIAYRGEPNETTETARPTAGAGLRLRAWQACGFLGGIAAILLAGIAQFLIGTKEKDWAAPFYMGAIVLLIASLTRLKQAPNAAPVGTLTTRPARTGGQQQTGAASPNTNAISQRAVLAGAASLLLAAASALTLTFDMASPVGGWLWAASLVALLLAAWQMRAPEGGGLLPRPKDGFFKEGTPRITPRTEALLMVVILGAALALRLANLEYLPGVFGDEGERGVDAARLAAGAPDNLFGYGWYSVPNLYFYVLAVPLRVFGSTMVGDRLLSVVSGMLMLVFAYGAARLLFGTRAALLTASFTAALPLALQFSRQATESTPTGALWAGGFYFLFRALRGGLPRDWTICGLCWGFSLYFYASGKLIVPISVAVLVYCAVMGRARLRQVVAGFAQIGAAMGLVYLPAFILNVKDNWFMFSSRAQETSIFTPSLQRALFERYQIPYDASWIGQPALTSIVQHPMLWVRLLYSQLVTTVDVLYKTGDPTAFYEIQIHNGSVLPPVLAALTLLGLAYAIWKFTDMRFGLISIWFWGGLLAVVLTTDTPSVQRFVGAWPAVAIFPAVLLDRVFASAWPLSRELAVKWSAVPLAGLALFLGVTGYSEYFGHYASLCPYCVATLQARYVQAQGSEYKAYELSAGDGLNIKYGSTRFLAAGVEAADVPAPAARLPVTDNNGKGAAFMVFPTNRPYLSLLKALYPGGISEDVRGSNGVAYFTSYKVSAADMARWQAATATYTSPDGHKSTRSEPTLGTTQAWAPPVGVVYPLQAEWHSGLYAPAFALYSFRVGGVPGITVEVDGKPLALQPTSGVYGQTGELILAQGLHDIYMDATIRDSGARPQLRWATGAHTPETVSANYLFSGSTGGVLAEIGPATNLDTLRSADPFGGQPPSDRRIYPAIGLRSAADAINSTGFTIRFSGTLHVDNGGRYTFECNTNGPCLVSIDNQLVLDNTKGEMGRIQNQTDLQAGAHSFTMLTLWGGGVSPVELFWTPPGRPYSIIPPSALSSLSRSWNVGEIPTP